MTVVLDFPQRNSEPFVSPLQHFIHIQIDGINLHSSTTSMFQYFKTNQGYINHENDLTYCLMVPTFTSSITGYTEPVSLLKLITKNYKVYLTMNNDRREENNNRRRTNQHNFPTKSFNINIDPRICRLYNPKWQQLRSCDSHVC